MGKKADLVKKILNILTYFIRCSDVQNNELGSLESYIDEVSLDSPVDDRPVITPIEEVCNMGQGQGQEVMHSSASSDRMEGSCDTITGDSNDGSVCDRQGGNNSAQQSVINNAECSHINQGSKHSGDLDSEPSVENVFQSESKSRPTWLSLTRQNGVECSGDVEFREKVANRESCRESSNTDEGYCSIVQSGDYDKSHLPCRLSDSEIRESVKVENVHHVSKAVTMNNSPCDISHSPLTPSSKKTKSLLTEKLSNENKETKVSTSEIRQRYLKEGSHSLFNEYFDDEEIVTKTIDQVEEHNRVVNHPLAVSKGAHWKISGSVDSIVDASNSHSGQSEIQGHDRRLGSLGHMVRPRIASVSRQISSDKGRQPAITPGRCRCVSFILLTINPNLTNLHIKHLNTTQIQT